MASSNLSGSSTGGSGCIVFHRTPTWLKVFWGKVIAFNIVILYLKTKDCVSALGHQSIECSAIEYVQLNPPAGMTCAQYLNPYISSAGGYLTNPDATSSCNFCSMSSVDTFLASGFNIFYHHHWRNFGFMIAYIVFNVSLPRCASILTKSHTVP